MVTKMDAKALLSSDAKLGALCSNGQPRPVTAPKAAVSIVYILMYI